jgi:hypothetical protein
MIDNTATKDLPADARTEGRVVITAMFIEGERDDYGRAPFTLFWRDPSGKCRGQCFRTRPELYIKRGVVLCASEEEAKARAWGFEIVLPPFELFKRQPKVPHVAHVVVTRDVPNDYGTPITYTVHASRKGNQWWIAATLRGHRMSNTLRTTSEAVAKRWIAAVETGAILIDREE